MKKNNGLFLAVTAGFFLLNQLSATAQHDKMKMDKVFNSVSADELRTNMRVLWEDHVIYTRNVILNIIDGLPGTDEAVARLLKNQDDIGNAIKPIYGDEAGTQLTVLLREHIVIAADLLKAAKAGNDAQFNTHNEKWKENADEIAAFLSAANPKNWSLANMKKMMRDHLDLTTQEAVARLKKDYKADIEAFDKTRDEILLMSDMLAAGIIRQFPGKFNR